MNNYSVFSIFGHALTGNKGWKPVWRTSLPKPFYDGIIDGGRGLAAAKYLAKKHGIYNVAVIEKGWLGGGSRGRNATIVCAGCMIPDNTMFCERLMRMWQKLGQELNFYVMVSQCGQYNLCHSVAQMDAARRCGNSMRANGIDTAEFLNRLYVNGWKTLQIGRIRNYGETTLPIEKEAITNWKPAASIQ